MEILQRQKRNHGSSTAKDHSLCSKWPSGYEKVVVGCSLVKDTSQSRLMGIACLQQQFIMAKGKSSGGRKGGRARRKYDVITTEMRIDLIKQVLGNGLTVAAACRSIGIKLTTGCLIIRNYRKQKRIFQKPGSIGPEMIPSFPSPRPKIEKKRSRAERIEARNAIREGEAEKPEKVEELVVEIKVQTEEVSEIPFSQPMPAALNSSPFPSVAVETAYQWVAYQFPMFFWTNQPY